jgi:hypothetical protein
VRYKFEDIANINDSYIFTVQWAIMILAVMPQYSGLKDDGMEMKQKSLEMRYLFGSDNMAQ